MNLSNHLNNLNEQKDKILFSFPLYPPLELFHSMDLTTLVLWGLKNEIRSTQHIYKHIQDYVCSIAKHLTEFILNNGNKIDFLFSYNACDSLRNLPEIIKEGLKEQDYHLPSFHIHLPMNSLDRKYTEEYLKDEFTHLISSLEPFIPNKISFKRFSRSVELFRELRDLKKGLEDLIVKNDYSYINYIKSMEACKYLSNENQIRFLESKYKEFLNKNTSKSTNKVKRVILSGILPPPPKIVHIIEESGLKVVGNDIAKYTRSLHYTPPKGSFKTIEDYYLKFYQNHFPCPTLLYTTDSRIPLLKEMIKQKEANGFIFIGEKFCEYEYFEIPILEKQLQDENVPMLDLEFSAEDIKNYEPYRTRIDAYSEILTTK
ncbi:MAG: hypothetical protein GF317_20260 [Candidatus Lokiarchaeota archaeon]|nr:hypothetical protein [Candidatus Lokiarchaeota archaeon]MBD3201822.1 hypothetical protein [Candidatus Lokiarchaeota archaeon]